MNGWAAWRARPWLWGLALGFLLLNLGLFMFYRVAYAGQVEVLQDRFNAENESYQQLREQRETLEGYLDRVKDSSDGISELYLNHFETEAERFTRASAELKRLARTAGLDPSSFNYASQDLGEMELRRLGITFSVEGTYDQVRRFINFLEIGEQFFILEQMTVNASSDRGQADPRLSINVSVSTVFASDGLARRTAAELKRRESREPVPSEGEDAGATDADAGSSVDNSENDETRAAGPDLEHGEPIPTDEAEEIEE